MSLHTNKEFFSRRKMLVTVLYFIIIFFFAYICTYSLSFDSGDAYLQDIKYCSASREMKTDAITDWKTAVSIDDIKNDNTDKYLYIEAVLPEIENSRLFVRSYNGTARILIDDNEVFNNFDGSRASGSSYIDIPLDREMSGKAVGMLIFSALSDDFDVIIAPEGSTVYHESNLPFALIYILLALLVVLVLSLLFCMLARGKMNWLPVVPAALSLVLALAVLTLEFSALLGDSHLLFGIKLFLYTLIPALCMTELAARFREWNARLEAVLSVNVLYAFCILFLSGNVFFYIILSSGIFLQAVNFLLVISILARQQKNESDIYEGACIAFWCINLVFWLAVAIQNVTWQPVALVLAVALYCLCSAICFYRKNRPLLNEHRGRINVPFSRSDKDSDYISDADGVSSAADSASKTAAERDDLHSGPDEYEAQSLSSGRPSCSENSMAAIKALNEMISKKAFGRDRHSFCVSAYSEVISNFMGMSKKTSGRIAMAATLHDIGKICVPESILAKTEQLTEEEFCEIRKHNIYGYQLLYSQEDPFLKMAALVAKEHHEHIDGSGYIGLTDTEISVPAKIVAVADVFDALVSQRSYKNPWSFDKAFGYICEHRSDYFDKDVVDAFIRAKDKIFAIYQSDAQNNFENKTEGRS